MPWLSCERKPADCCKGAIEEAITIDRIKVLDADTANQIAAGEVVERPSSVVKELVENSIDAASSQIEVKIEEGGITFIQVVDNGSGMSRRDCELAFLRHATSKLSSADELPRIGTLGFRGEALPSIAAVSKLSLISKMSGQLEGTLIELEGGILKEIQPIGCPSGTNVQVRDLFFNTPPRKKFLKTPATEASHAAGIVQKLALAHPEISFKFFHNHRLNFSSPGTGRLIDVLFGIYGLDIANNLIPLEYTDSIYRITGYLGKSYFHRSSREHQVFIVNGRFVRSAVFQRALDAAYGSSIPNRRYPMAVIFLELNPEYVDVNVHPTKMIVKFADENGLLSILVDAFKKGLQSASHIPYFPAKNLADEKTLVQEPVQSYEQTTWDAFIASQAVEKSAVFQEKEETAAGLETAILYPAPCRGKSSFPVLRAVGQIHGTYIIAQHAAHEIIKYEELLEKSEGCSLHAQALALPQTMEVSPLEHQLLIEQIVLLRDLGIILEQFGKNTYLIRALPPELGAQDGICLVKDILEMLQAGNANRRMGGEMRQEFLKLIACKQAVKAKKQLTLPEQQSLLEKLGKLKNPYTCPHGRPVLIHLSISELDRRFQRS
jgi:DNA mismatch repair protein MutL